MKITYANAQLSFDVATQQLVPHADAGADADAAATIIFLPAENEARARCFNVPLLPDAEVIVEDDFGQTFAFAAGSAIVLESAEAPPATLKFRAQMTPETSALAMLAARSFVQGGRRGVVVELGQDDAQDTCAIAERLPDPNKLFALKTDLDAAARAEAERDRRGLRFGIEAGVLSSAQLVRNVDMYKAAEPDVDDADTWLPVATVGAYEDAIPLEFRNPNTVVLASNRKRHAPILADFPELIRGEAVARVVLKNDFMPGTPDKAHTHSILASSGFAPACRVGAYDDFGIAYRADMFEVWLR